MLVARGQGASERNSGEALGECPICFEQLRFDGPRTVVRPFRCTDGRHPICRACDSTMYRRHDDRCPTCRAERDVGASNARHGGRVSGVPFHLRTPDGDGPLAGEMWMLGGIHLVPSNTGPMWFPVDTSGFDNAEDADEAFLHGPSMSVVRAVQIPVSDLDPSTRNTLHELFRFGDTFGNSQSRGRARAAPSRAASRASARGGGGDEREEGSDGDGLVAAEAIGNAIAAVEHMITDPATRSAIEGLRSVPAVPLGSFVHRVHGNAQAWRARTRRAGARRL